MCRDCSAHGGPPHGFWLAGAFVAEGVLRHAGCQGAQKNTTCTGLDFARVRSSRKGASTDLIAGTGSSTDVRTRTHVRRYVRPYVLQSRVGSEVLGQQGFALQFRSCSRNPFASSACAYLSTYVRTYVRTYGMFAHFVHRTNPSGVTHALVYVRPWRPSFVRAQCLLNFDSSCSSVLSPLRLSSVVCRSPCRCCTPAVAAGKLPCTWRSRSATPTWSRA